MKLTINSKALLKALQLVSPAISNQTTMPILDNFLFEYDVDKLKITATDIETAISTEVEAECKEKGSIAIPSKLLLDMLKSFSNHPIEFNVVGKIIKVKSPTGIYSLPFTDAMEYPKAIVLDNPPTFSVPSGILTYGISRTIIAAANDELRPQFSSVLIAISEQGLKFVGTDGHKLVEYIRQDISSEIPTELMLSKKPLSILKAIVSDDDVKVEYNHSNAVFTFSNCSITCRLVDGKYLSYQPVIPKNSDKKLLINRSMLTGSLKRILNFANKTSKSVIFKASVSSLNISTKDVDFSTDASEDLTCDYIGEDITISFNAVYLLEMLNNLNCEDVNIEMTNYKTAVLITPADSLDDGEKIIELNTPQMLS